jgi:hypothetical protein
MIYRILPQGDSQPWCEHLRIYAVLLVPIRTPLIYVQVYNRFSTMGDDNKAPTRLGLEKLFTFPQALLFLLHDSLYVMA